MTRTDLLVSTVNHCRRATPFSVMTTNKQADWHFLILLSLVPVWLLSILKLPLRPLSDPFLWKHSGLLSWGAITQSNIGLGVKVRLLWTGFFLMKHLVTLMPTSQLFVSLWLSWWMLWPASWGFNYCFSITWFQPPAGVSTLPWHNGFSLKLIRTWGEGRTRARKQLLRLHVQVCG